jgi:hypothetical protein
MAGEGPPSTPFIGAAKRRRCIALQVLLTAVLIHAGHAALEDAEEPFHAFRGNVVTGVFLRATTNVPSAGYIAKKIFLTTGAT